MYMHDINQQKRVYLFQITQKRGEVSKIDIPYFNGFQQFELRCFQVTMVISLTLNCIRYPALPLVHNGGSMEPPQRKPLSHRNF